MFSATARKATASRLLIGARRTLVSSSHPHRIVTTRGPPRGWTVSRPFSSAATTTTTTTTTTTDKPLLRDFFLDHLGKIFLGIIATIVLGLVRSSYGTSNMKDAVAEIEESAALDPLEIDELRRANAELTPELFRSILQELATDPSAMTYEEFVLRVRTILTREKGPHGTIAMGFLLDRVVIAALKNGMLFDQPTQNQPDEDCSTALPLTFWFVVLSLALNGPVPDRIRLLYQVLEQFSSHPSNSVTLQDVTNMVRYLQETCQLPPDKQVVPTDTKYPTQQYRRGTPEELVQWGEAAEAAGSAGSQPSPHRDPKEVLDVDAFADILRSKSVCAWGECYFKTKFVP